MPRRTVSRHKTEVELFPFLSVLACTIGTLILLIVVLTSQTAVSQKEVKIIAKNEKGENQTKTPRYIECRKDGVMIYPSKKLVTIANLDKKNSDLQKLLTEIKKNNSTQYLIVAVRPDAIQVFKGVRAIVELQNIDIGYEPLDKGWQLQVQ